LRINKLKAEECKARRQKRFSRSLRKERKIALTTQLFHSSFTAPLPNGWKNRNGKLSNKQKRVGAERRKTQLDNNRKIAENQLENRNTIHSNKAPSGWVGGGVNFGGRVFKASKQI